MDTIAPVVVIAQVVQAVVIVSVEAVDHITAQEAEVAFNVVETLVVGGIGQRVAVLIEREQTAPLTQLRKDMARVTSTAKCKVAICAVGADIHQIYRLLQQYGHVVCCSV